MSGCLLFDLVHFNVNAVFQSAFKMFLVPFINVLFAGVIAKLIETKCPCLFSPLMHFAFMSLTAAHPSTPFWCFVVPESSSHLPVHNPLCAHQRERASVGHTGGRD